MKKYAGSLVVLTCMVLCLGGCGKKETEVSTPGQEEQPAAEVLLDESSEEFGEIEEENTEEETGEVMEEITINASAEADTDGVIVELGKETEGFSWTYKISDENRMKLESEYEEKKEDGLVQQYVFRAQEPGKVVLSFFYTESGEEIEIPEGDDPADYSDVFYTVQIGEDLSVELAEE